MTVTPEVVKCDKSTDTKLWHPINKLSIFCKVWVSIFPKIISCKLVHPLNILLIDITWEASKLVKSAFIILDKPLNIFSQDVSWASNWRVILLFASVKVHVVLQLGCSTSFTLTWEIKDANSPLIICWLPVSLMTISITEEDIVTNKQQKINKIKRLLLRLRKGFSDLLLFLSFLWQGIYFSVAIIFIIKNFFNY